MPDGEVLTLWWGLPFAAVLVSLALGPFLFKSCWPRLSVYCLGGFSGITLMGILMTYAWSVSRGILLHLMIHDYIPFMLLIAALYIISGGIVLEVSIKRSPVTNTLVLFIGTLCASVLGTTGAVMLFIRPLIHVNKARSHKTHIIVFLIILLGNIGGSLTPLGDPPLFLGYLNGIDFLWFPQHMVGPFLVMVLPLLAIFFALDSWFLHKEGRRAPYLHKRSIPWLRVHGKINFLFLFLVLACVALIQSKTASSLTVWGVSIDATNLLRDGALILLIGGSLWATPKHIKAENKFSWKPLIEVCYVFFAIFTTVLPVLSILEAREAGALGFLIQSLHTDQGVPIPALFFWVTGLCSAVLDNAPTYLVFLKATGLSINDLMNSQRSLLVALSTGAVFMGALTYIGNAPNFLAKSMAQDYGIKMPGFFAYTFYGALLLVPLFFLLSYLFF